MPIGTPATLGTPVNSTTVTQLVLTTAADAAASSFIMAFGSGVTASTNFSTVVDSKSNAYTVSADPGAPGISYAFTNPAIVLPTGQTITGNFAGAAAAHGLAALAVTGISSAADPRDKVPSGLTGTGVAATAINSGVLA